MKKFGFLLLAACASLAMSSCDLSDEDFPRYDPLFVTVRTLGNADYYFQRSNGETLYPGDKSRVTGYAPEDGDAAVIYFNLLPEEAEGYDYHISLYAVDDVLTKDARIIATREELTAIGDDPVDILHDRYGRDLIWIDHGRLNICFGLLTAPASIHTLNLIRNDVDTPAQHLEGYTGLEFRQNVSGDHIFPEYGTKYVSFRLNELDPSVTGSKGLYVRVRTTANKIVYYKVPAQTE